MSSVNTSPSSETMLWDLRDMLRALGDVARLQMVHVLAGSGEMSVTDLGGLVLVDGRHISQPLISWHLRVLRKSGLVRTRRMGRIVYCSLDHTRYQHCLRLLREVVGEAPATPTSTVDSAANAGVGGAALG